MKAHTDNSIAPPSVSLRSRLGNFLVAAAIFLLLISARSSFAGSATWKASPATGDWNTATNWTASTVPNGASDTATFATSNKTGVSVSLNTEVNGIVFNAGASAFTITASPSFILTISGVGITNNSGITQNFVAANLNGTITFGGTAGSGNIFTIEGGVASGQGGGEIDFGGTSNCGDSTFIVNGGAISNALQGQMIFSVTATADNSAIMVNGGVGSGAIGGRVLFFDTSTAGNATLIINGGSSGGDGATVDFIGKSKGGTARAEVFNTGALRVDHLKRTILNATIGSIEGNGNVILASFGSGQGKNLIVGANNLNTTFSGLIDDAGAGGSLTKVGHGKLTLSSGNSYTGGTTINKGSLLTKNTTGSATGSGPVQVNGGTFGGTGKINGAVTVGTGTSSGAILLPGNSATKPGTLTINNPLTFRSLSTYKCVLNRATPKASKVFAFGVTINSNVPFTFVDTGTGALATGTVFTVINNTSASPISGTFSNLPNGSVFASNGTTFKASYSGGTGNDLTLTVQ